MFCVIFNMCITLNKTREILTNEDYKFSDWKVTINWIKRKYSRKQISEPNHCEIAEYLLLLLLLLSHFSRVRLCVTPSTAAHRAPPSLGFSRQEHWSGLPFPSPMRESEKWKWSRSVVSGSSQPRGLQPTRLLRPWDFPGKSTGVGCYRLLRRIPGTEINY